MACFNKQDARGQQYWTEAHQGHRLNLSERATEVMQIRVPTVCGSKVIRDETRSNWLPILRKITPLEQESIESTLPQQPIEFENKMSLAQEKSWIQQAERTLKGHQQVTKSTVRSGALNFETLNMHELMNLSQSEYKTFKRMLSAAVQEPKYAEWMRKYEQEMPLLFVNVANSFRDYFTRESSRSAPLTQVQKEFQSAVERSYLFVAQHVIAERESVPRDDQERPLQPSIGSLMHKVWMTLRQEMTSEEVHQVQVEVSEYLEKFRYSNPEQYQLQFGFSDEVSNEKNSDLKHTSINMLNVLYSALRLAGQKPHKYNAPALQHQEWAFDDVRAEQELAKAQRWMKNSQLIQKTDEQEKSEQFKDAKFTNKWSQYNEQLRKTGNQDDKFDSFDRDEPIQEGGLFNTIKLVMRSFNKNTARN
jgi:hypothetical protein